MYPKAPNISLSFFELNPKTVEKKNMTNILQKVRKTQENKVLFQKAFYTIILKYDLDIIKNNN